MKSLFFYLIFPGFLFTGAVGIFASWFDRKITARVQWRRGPPLLQPLYDVVKLLGKELILPQNSSSWTYLVFPLVGLAGSALAASILWLAFLFPERSFVGDIIVVIYLMSIPAISLIVASFASANPLASQGASREIKLLLSYELPFILATIAVLIKVQSLKLGGLIFYQAVNGLNIASFSGALAFMVALLCTQAKLGLVPFDIAEAETEIMAGACIEFSGPLLAIFRMTKYIMLVAAPLFLVTLFLGNVATSPGGLLVLGLKYLTVVLLTVLIRNTNPRLRIDQAMKFFWGPATLLAAVAVLLALFGK